MKMTVVHRAISIKKVYMFTITNWYWRTRNCTYFMVVIFKKIGVSKYYVTMTIREWNFLACNPSKTMVMPVLAFFC